jgi:hypothetical protein
VFRCELEAFPKFAQADFYMDVDLMFTELSKITEEGFRMVYHQ